MKNKNHYIFLASSISVLLVWSVINPNDFFTWVLETFPVFIGLGFIIYGVKKDFHLTPLTLYLSWFFAIILIIGGHYTYAEEPFFEMLQNKYDLKRNYYDRFGHVVQGITPVIIAREILLRTSPLVKGKWLNFLCLAVTMAISAIYEIIEWLVAMLSGDDAVKFLATQGDQWDPQWDMFLCLIGAILSLVILKNSQNKQLEKFLR